MARKLLLLLAGTVALLVASAPAGAAGPLASFSFGAAPTTKAGVAARSYFSFTAHRGETIRDSIIVTNGSPKPQVLALSPSVGATASNSGYGYVGAFARCRGAGCWIHDLPSHVTVGPRARKVVKFSVVVPAGARDRQYLAGITVQPAKRAAPKKLGSRNGVGARAIVITRVNVGVAITVGTLANLRRMLQVESLHIVASDGAPRIVVKERNTGDTFVSATGTAVCLDGARRFAYPLLSRTILPADTALLTLNAPGLRRGASLRCTATLAFGSGRTPAVWKGVAAVPSTRPPTVIQTGPHTFSQVPKAGVPKWAIALIAAGGAIVLGLLVVIVLLLRRRPPAPAT